MLVFFICLCLYVYFYVDIYVCKIFCCIFELFIGFCFEKEEMMLLLWLMIFKRSGCCNFLCVCDEYVYLYMYDFVKKFL